MARYFDIFVVFVIFGLVASVLSQADDEGQWVDDVSSNPETMGYDSSAAEGSPSLSFSKDETGEWVDDVTGNLIYMGEDPSSQDTGLGGKIEDFFWFFSVGWQLSWWFWNSTDANRRKRRSLRKKLAKKLTKKFGRNGPFGFGF